MTRLFRQFYSLTAEIGIISGFNCNFCKLRLTVRLCLPSLPVVTNPPTSANLACKPGNPPGVPAWKRHPVAHRKSSDRQARAGRTTTNNPEAGSG
jgi:hypothetical protein